MDRGKEERGEMAKLKKPLPQFRTEEEEAKYWDTHSPLEHFDISDFEPLQVKALKTRLITIRLDSRTRQKLDKIAKIRKVGPSTLARIFIINALEEINHDQTRPLKPNY